MTQPVVLSAAEKSTHRPTISVVMPVYKRAYTLRKTIESILAQTYTDFEFVIVLDGPDAELQTIVEGFSDPRIRLIVSDQNMGVTKALNLGLKNTTGKYFARMDNGDFADPKRLENHLQSLETLSASVSFCHAAIIEPDGRVIEETGSLPWILRLWMSMFSQSLGTAGSALFVDNGLLKSIGGFDENFKYAQDYEISQRLASLGKEFAYSEGIGLITPMYEDGISKKKLAIQEGFARQVMARATRRYLPDITEAELKSLAAWRDRFRLEGEDDPTLAVKLIPKLARAFAEFHGLKRLPFSICNDIAQFTELNLRLLREEDRNIAFRTLVWCAIEAKSMRLFRYVLGCAYRFYITKELVGHSTDRLKA